MNPEQLWDTTLNPETRTLYKVTIEDAAKAEMAAASLKLAAEDAKSIGVIERILSENDIGKKEFYDRIRTLLMEELKVLSEEADLIQSRYDRFRKLGVSAVVKE